MAGRPRNERDVRGHRVVRAGAEQHRPGHRVEGLVRQHDRALRAQGTAGESARRVLDHEPARIALDFLDTANALGATQRVVDDVELRSFNVIQSGNLTRVVFP